MRWRRLRSLPEGVADRTFTLSVQPCLYIGMNASNATPAQLSYIAKLAAAAGVDANEVTTKSEASVEIDRLKKAGGDTRRQGPAVELEEGMYIAAGRVFRVIRGKTGGNLYAKELLDGAFVYAPGVIRDLTPDHRMTLEQAASIGHLTGQCCVCARTLTKPESVTAGIGPVCSGRL